jgi:hypothetical protein
MRGFPVRIDGPAQVSLFAYDNHTFIVESYSDKPADVKISVAGDFTHLKNLVTGDEIDGRPPAPARWARDNADDRKVSFQVQIPPHSYEVFEIEK